MAFRRSSVISLINLVGGTSYRYDKNGNLVDDGTYKYYYDCENRLTDVNDFDDDTVASYYYDYQGRRVKKVVYGSPNWLIQGRGGLPITTMSSPPKDLLIQYQPTEDLAFSFSRSPKHSRSNFI